MNRQTILDALFAVVTAPPAGGVPTFVTTGRRLQLWSEVDAQPALFQRYLNEKRAPLHMFGLPQGTVIDVELWIYVKNGGPDDSPELKITPLLDALDVALRANATYDGRQTLGLEGYVSHAWIEGETNISQGEQSDQSIVVVPVKIAVDALLGAP